MKQKSRQPEGAVRLLRLKDMAAVERFAARYRFKPYSYYSQIDSQGLTEYFVQGLRRALAEDLVYGWVVNHRVQGIVIYEALLWDSRIFGVPMGRISLHLLDGADGAVRTAAGRLLATSMQSCMQKRLQHLVCRIDTREVPAAHALEQQAFHLVDTITVLALKPSELRVARWSDQAHVRIRQMHPDDLSPMSRLSRATFANRDDIVTRFTYDPLLSWRAGTLYAEWLRNSSRGEQADIVFVAEAKRRPVGFITCKLSGPEVDHLLGIRIGAIPLNAVNPLFRRRGVYTQLVLTAVEWFQQRGMDYVELKTQIHSLGVHRAWRRLQGYLAHSYYVFHYWRRPQR